jgi:high-affinity iron transporter
MLASAIIVFRESLEAAILIGILAAATRSVPGRAVWLTGGIAVGLIAATLVAFFAEQISNAVSGIGQELLNAGVLVVAVLTLAWHNLWMSSHGASLAAQARGVGEQVRGGNTARSALLLVVALAVLREGAETVLFLFGVATSGETSATALTTGAVAGLLCGVISGYALYAGLLRIPLRHLFTATSLMVLFIAAGLASQATRFLIQADLIPALATPLWDSSSIVAPASVPGTLLHGFIGYDARPSGMQVIVYAIVLMSIGIGMRLVEARK